MNLRPGGKQNKMRNTAWGPNNQHQEMIFPNDYHIPEFRGKPKGMEQVLRERGFWDKKYVADCSLCKNKTTRDDPT